jgi:hypothetical protein
VDAEGVPAPGFARGLYDDNCSVHVRRSLIRGNQYGCIA